ncbi:proto-oncogene Mas-like [Elgaria multicarinata webbii]|uniref:proto-oncogene Mas-like n=1 Tax=Elgaria multicarinata webbii TaxID=159646 RepID=UPI002FCCF932
MVMAEASVLSSHTAGADKKMGKIIDSSYTLQERMLFTSIPLCALGLTGNGIVLWLLCCKINMKLKLYFLSVAVANLIIIFCNFVIVVLYFTQIYPSLMFQRVMQILHICGYDTSFYLFTAITVERCLNVFVPVWYQYHRPNNFSATVCSVLWGLSFILSFVDYYACSPRFQVDFHTFVVACRTSTIIDTVIELFIFLPSLLCCTLAIWIRMQKREPGTAPARLDITIVAVVLLILILNTPVRTAHIMTFWTYRIDRYMLNNISLLMDSLNSTCNPFVYFFVGNWKRQKSSESILMFLERALKAEELKAERTKGGQEQA